MWISASAPDALCYRYGVGSHVVGGKQIQPKLGALQDFYRLSHVLWTWLSPVHIRSWIMLLVAPCGGALVLQAIKETWASHCDGFVAFSNVDDPDLNS